METLLNVCRVNRISLRHCLALSNARLTQNELFKLLPNSLTSLLKLEGNELIDRFKLLDRYESRELSFVFIIPSYNNIAYLVRNLGSVFAQKYVNYRVIYIDDCSVDGTYQMVKRLVTKYQMWDRFRLCRQPVRNYQSGSRFSAYHLCDDDEILCMLDGDDWLANSNVLAILNQIYRQGALCSYGSYRRLENGRLGMEVYGNEDFPLEILKNREFRHYRWTSCHFRTGYAGLFKKIDLVEMLDLENRFIRCSTDLCEMMPVLEMSSPKIKKCLKVLYIYNKDASILNSNSFYQIQNNPDEKLYRDYVEHKIKSGKKYTRISLEELLLGRKCLAASVRCNYLISKEILNLGDEIVDRLVWLLKSTHLSYLGHRLQLTNPLYLYHKSIKIGNLVIDKNVKMELGIKKHGYLVSSGDLVISIDDYQIDYLKLFSLGLYSD